MSEQTFEDRLAALEEHIVKPEYNADYHLARAEYYLSRGIPSAARMQLSLAKLARPNELEQEDDDAC